MEEIIGTVRRIKYKSEETGYTVCLVDVSGEELTVVGKLPFLNAGEEIHAFGNYTIHREFGKQFSVESFTKQLPNESSGILQYLSSGAIKGIGVSTAAKIVDMFGEQTFEIIENFPTELVKIRGINLEKAKNISNIFKDQYGIRELLVFFSRYAVSPNSAIKIWKRWGHLSIDIIKANPFALTEQAVAIPFAKCDELAFNLGIEKENELRISSGITYVLSHNFYSNGHTYLPMNKLLEVSTYLLEVDAALVEKIIKQMVEHGSLASIMIKNVEGVSLKKSFQTELFIAKDLLRRAAKSERFEVLDNFIDKLQKNYNIEYDNHQREAISAAVNNMVMILTGGPGTGKTTTLKALIRIFEDMGLSVILAAPTGRAVKRMEELCGKEAKTIHRLLEMEYTGDETQRFFKDENNKIEGDVVIIDEVSMVDITLLEGLLRAMDVGTRLVMVGDADQLPSVGAGNVLGDIIKSCKIPSIKLEKIFRQAGKSLIVTNSHKIINGVYPTLNINNNDFFFIPKSTANGVIETVCDLVNRRLPNSYGYNALSDIQVITPSKMASCGTHNLNVVLREILNEQSKTKSEKTVGNITFRTGDKVMQTRNNYEISFVRGNGEEGKGVFNGDIGIIEQISQSQEKVYIQFDDRYATYEMSDLKELDHAYAITVHKSQGSEFEAVVMPIFKGSSKLYYRNLLYTAVTRAKKLVIIVGEKEKIYEMVDNNITSGRYTALDELLRIN